jgi:uncharacterized tellurite resistance protein B-like protein
VHAITLLQIAVAAADGVIENIEIEVLVDGLAERLDSDEAQAKTVADQTYAYLHDVWKDGGANATDAAISAQVHYLKDAHADEPARLEAYVAALVEVADASPGIHRAEKDVIARVMDGWGIAAR